METVKEKLNKLIHTAADYSVEMCERYVDCNSCPHFGDSCYAMTDYLIQNGVTIQEWVSVDERLPEEEGKYIVCTAKNTVYCAKYHAKGKFFGTDMHTHITHWMPLPALPKGDNSNE